MKPISAALFMSLALLASAQRTQAQTPAANAAAAPPAIPGWNAFVDGLRVLPGQILAQLPADERNDPQVQQEVGRLVLEGLASSSIAAIAADGDHPRFLPGPGQVLDVGQPNADTVYRTARITPGGIYRLRGQRGSLLQAVIVQIHPNLGEGATKATHVGAASMYDDINALHVDAHGRFDVILSPARPAGYTGDWWQLDPGAVQLLLRMVSDDWAAQASPSISIERIDAPVEAPRPPAAVLQARLARLPTATAAITLLFAGHVEQLQQKGYLNKFLGTDFSQLGGLKGQFYYEGAYHLRDDQALLVEAKIPAKCKYYSILLTDELYETTDWTDNQSSLNDAQAKPDKDGVWRIVVSAKDPGVPNWLDTAGYPLGVIQGRWTGCTSHPVPSAQIVPLIDVRKFLPPDTAVVTPAARQQTIRDRRAAFQQRPLW
jgi:hypothetical protein